MAHKFLGWVCIMSIELHVVVVIVVVVVVVVVIGLCQLLGIFVEMNVVHKFNEVEVFIVVGCLLLLMVIVGVDGDYCWYFCYSNPQKAPKPVR